MGAREAILLTLGEAGTVEIIGLNADDVKVGLGELRSLRGHRWADAWTSRSGGRGALCRPHRFLVVHRKLCAG
jgi:hypothetical protein